MIALLLALTARVELAPSNLPCEGIVRAVRADDAVVREAPLRDSAAVLPLPDDAARVELQSEQCWAAAVPTDTGLAPIRLQVWPAARLRGEVAVANGVDVPAAMQLRFESPPRTARPVPRTDTRCEVRERRWSCLVPNAPLDVRLSADGFVPVYFWEKTPAEPLGVVRLERGASISGWVIDPAKSSTPIEVTLAPSTFPDVRDRRQGLRAQTVRASARGFFQFGGLATGELYTITARRAGRAPAHARDIIVNRAAEHALPQPLELGDLGAIELTVTPSATPGGDPWRIVVKRRVDSRGILVDAGEMKKAGESRWRLDGLEPGEYRVSVHDAAGATYHRADADVGSGVSELAFQISAVPVRGRVHMGDDPLEAALKFEHDGRRITLRSDADGRFEGSLPDEGDWTVRIDPSAARMRTRERKVPVKRDAESGVAELDIALPRTWVSGTVVDENGRPLQDANVQVWRKGRYETNGISGADGTFELIALDPGPVELRALTRDAESPAVPVTLLEDDGAEVVLKAARRSVVRGVVVGRDGRPLAGALIRWYDRHVGEETTGPTGEFTLRVAPGTQQLDLAVLAPGYPVRLDTIPVQAQPVRIVLGGQRGLLRIRLPETPPWPALRRNGRTGFLLTTLLAPRYGGPPRELTDDGFVLELEPDNYAICYPGMGCQPVTVPPGGSAEWTAQKEGKPTG